MIPALLKIIVQPGDTYASAVVPVILAPDQDSLNFNTEKFAPRPPSAEAVA
jgi:hypothetical protein